MFDFIKKKECSNCGKKTRKTINYAGYDICSESCMRGFFKNKTTEELLELNKKDMIRADRYFKLYNHPLGNEIYMNIGLDFKSQEEVEEFMNTDINWGQEIEAIEVTKEEYEENTVD